MFKVDIYVNSNGESELLSLISKLQEKKNTSKDARIKYEKIIHYVKLLEAYGTNLSEINCKHIENEIWELRPGKYRILFAHDEIKHKYILLNYFIKKTNKTPKSEIIKANKMFKDYYWRSYEIQ